MYIYIYDEFTNQVKYNKLLYKIEKRLTDLNLNGETIRLGALKNIRTAIEDKIKRGAKTIVAVGDDKTTSQIINIMASQSDEENYLTLGIIPLDEKNNYIANKLGIKSIEDACDILLGRRIKTFKLAQINQSYFLFKADIEGPGIALEIDKSYAIQNAESASIEIMNTLNSAKDSEKKNLKLNMYSKDNQTSFPFSELLVVNRDIPIITDNSLAIEGPARIKPSLEEIKIIVGRQRRV